MNPKKPLLCLAAALAVTITISACSGGSNPADSQTGPAASSVATKSASAQPQAWIGMKSDGFSPVQVTVKPGTMVTWNNLDTAPHGVALDGSSAKSGDVAPGKSASHVFTTAGTFNYHDSRHPDFKGVVMVKP